MILHWKIAFTSLKYSFHSNPNSRCFVLVHFQSLNAPNSPPLHILETGYFSLRYVHACVTRTHDVHCHCKTYVALFSTHLTKISTWILYCTETNEKFYLYSTQCIQGRKWKKICQVGSNKHENFT